MIHVLTFSEAGGHPVNEDAFAVRPHPADPGCWLVCLADGQGGRAGGARAAQLACETAVALAAQYPPAELLNPATWQTVLAGADAAVAADPVAGFTTLIGMGVRDDHVTGASCGDSAVLAVDPAGSRVLTDRQWKNPPAGSGEAFFAPFAEELVRPWRVLVMSDGVWKYAGWDKINRAARAGGEELLAELQQAARLRGTGQFPDDFTVVLLEAAT
jgi:hypothetical protein